MLITILANLILINTTPPEPPITPGFGSGGAGGQEGGRHYKGKDKTEKEILDRNNEALILALSAWVISKD